MDQLFSEHNNTFRRLDTDSRMVALYSQHGGLYVIAFGSFEDDGFAWTAGEYEHNGLLAAVTMV